MNQPVEGLGNFPQIEVNPIGETLVMELNVFDSSTTLIIRRLPIDYSDSKEIWQENWESVKNLPSINLS